MKLVNEGSLLLNASTGKSLLSAVDLDLGEERTLVVTSDADKT